MKYSVRLICIMVLLTFLFTCFQGQQSTAAANDGQYVADISQAPSSTDSVNKLDFICRKSNGYH